LFDCFQNSTKEVSAAELILPHKLSKARLLSGNTLYLNTPLYIFGVHASNFVIEDVLTVK